MGPVASLLLSALAVFSPRDCPIVFGDQTDVVENEAFRTAHLNFILDEPEFSVIDHSGDWEAPSLVEVRSLELVRTSTAGPTAFIKLDASSERIDCRDGLYAVGIDDDIGGYGRILAILEDALVIEVDGSLGYMLAPEGDRRDWRMTWSSSYSMVPYVASGSGGGKRTAGKARRQPRSGLRKKRPISKK